jgi:glycosyltransferase involved in cell wall biosynthesis
MTALAGFHPFFVMSWGSDILVDSGRDGFWRWMTRYALAHSDRLVCDNDAVRLKVRQLVPYPENRMVQFPWGVDVQQFAPGEDVRRLRDKLGWHDSFLVLSTRSWEKIYGVETLLDAFRLAHSHNSSLRLVMLGSGSLAPNVEKAIAEFGIEHVVALPGRVANELLPDYYRAADLYLSCTTSDGTSVSLLEAMATGLPVIVADVPGNREWVTEGDNGWLAGVADSAAFARAIIEAAELRPEERSRIASRNRRIVEQRANWDSNFPKLLAAYDEAGTEHAC